MWLSPKVILDIFTSGLFTAVVAQSDDKVNPEAAMAVFAIGAISLGLSSSLWEPLFMDLSVLQRKGPAEPMMAINDLNQQRQNL